MNKIFMVVIALFLMSGLVLAQGGTWEYVDAPLCGYTTATDLGADGVTVPGLKNLYSVALDGDGNIWAGTYYSRKDEFTSEYPDLMLVITEHDTGTGVYYDTTEVWNKPIWIYNPNTKMVDTLRTLELPDGTLDTLTSHRGMEMDPDGNVIVSCGTGDVYKVDYQTRKALAHYNTGGSNGRPGVDAEGFVYQMDGVFASRVDILDPDDWTSPYNQITGISAGVTRCLEVSPDGKHVFVASSGGGAHHYYSADGVDGTYALVDTILSTAWVDTVEHAFYVNLVQWHPNGLLWLWSYDDIKARYAFAVDPDQDFAIVDTLNFTFWASTDGSDTTWGGYAKPQYVRTVRDAEFDAEGNNFYAAEFYGYTVKHFKFVPSTDIQPGQDSKVVPGTFTLYRNYPNPFNPTTTIPFELHKKAFVNLKVYDSRGREVGSYINEEMGIGKHNFKFDGSNLASGTYYFKITVDTKVATGRMVLVK